MKHIFGGACVALAMAPAPGMGADIYLQAPYGVQPPVARVLAPPLPQRRVIVEQASPLPAGPTRVIEHHIIEGPGYRTRTTRVTEQTSAYGIGVHAPRPPRDIPVVSHDLRRSIATRPVVVAPSPVYSPTVNDEYEDDFE